METTLISKENKAKLLEKHDEAAKVVAVVMGICGGKVIEDILKAILPAQARPILKLITKLGCVAISAFAADRLHKGLVSLADESRELLEDFCDTPVEEVEVVPNENRDPGMA